MDQETINKIKELFKVASPEIKEVILSDELNTETNYLAEKYKINLDLLIDLKNIIILTLLGEIKTEDLPNHIKEKMFIGDESTNGIIEYLDQGIFEKARMRIGTSSKENLSSISKKSDEIKEIKFSYDPIKEKLREQLMNHPLPKSEMSKKEENGEGSREKLLEKLKVIDDIPTDEDVLNRLEIINEQIREIKSKSKEEETHSVTEKVAEEIEKEGDAFVESKPKTAPYSKPPTNYNIDPYRETPDEI